MRSIGFIVILLYLSLLFGEQTETTIIYPPFKHTWGIHKGTEAKLDMLLNDRTDFDDPQGLALTKLKSHDDPNDKGDDDEITAFGVNSGRGEIIYNSSMYSLALYGNRGSGVGEFLRPHGICATQDGDVYIADTGNRRIVHLRIPKRELHWVKAFGQDSLLAPFDVKAVPGGTLYVADEKRNSVVVFDTSGRFIREFKKVIAPRGIDVDCDRLRWSAYKTNFIAVVDSFGKRIVKMNRINGKILATFRMSQLNYDDADLRYVALDYLDNIYVTDYNRCQVHKFDKNLEYLTSIGRCGTRDGEFDQPRGIAIWRRFGQIVIAERASAQYFWVGVDVKNFSAEYDAKNRAISVSFFVTEEAYFTVWLKGNGENRKLGRKRRINSGKKNLSIKIPSDVGHGKYTITFTIEPTYSSKGYLKKEFKRKMEL